MADMEWLEDAEVELAVILVACQALKLVPGTNELTTELRRLQKTCQQLIAAVRLAEKGYRELYDGLDMNLANRSEFIQLVQEYRARLRSGDVEEKPCKPS